GHDRVAAETTLHEIAHRVRLRLFRGDQAFAQQELDVTVIAAARDHRSMPQMVEPAIADMGPPRRSLLYQADGACSAWALLDRELSTELHDFLVRAPQRQVEKTKRIEERLRRLSERLQDDLLRDLGRFRSIGVATHTVDHDEQRRLLGDRYRDPILVLLAPAQEADVGVVDPQEEFHASVRLGRALYHPAANERSFRLHKPRRSTSDLRVPERGPTQPAKVAP